MSGSAPAPTREDPLASPNGPSAPPTLVRRGRGRRRAPRRTRTPLLVAGLVLLVVGLLVLAATAWLGVRGRAATDALVAAQEDLESTRTALGQGDVDAARAHLRSAQQQTDRARSIASDPVFSLAAALPVVGSSAEALRTVSQTADDVTYGPLEDLLTAATLLDPRTLRISGSRFDVDAIERASLPLDDAVQGLKQAQARLAGLDLAGSPQSVQDGVASFASQLDETSNAAQSVAQDVRILPGMLGAHGPRTYFLALQSNNEIRGTGGFFGAFGVIEVDHGQLSIKRLAPSSNVMSTTFDKPPVDFGRGYQQLYGDAPASWTSANLSPHFPYAARLWRQMYDVRKGILADGVIAVDPVTLQYLLDATGPIELPDGRVLGPGDVVPFTENTIYGTIRSDPVRDAYLQLVAKAAFRSILGGGGSPQALLDGLQRAASERRVLVWSSRPAEEAVLARTQLGGVIPRGPRPFAGLAVNNASGNKMDYYLQESLAYAGRSCLADGARATRITVTLTNTAAPGTALPYYVSERADLPKLPNGQARRGDGTYVVDAQVYATQGAVLDAARLDGRPVDVASGREQGKAVFRVPVELHPGATATVTLDLVEPPLPSGVDPSPQTFVTPVVLPSTTTVTPLTCTPRG